MPKISKKADVPNRGNHNGEYPCGEDILGFEQGREPFRTEMEKKGQDRGGTGDA